MVTRTTSATVRWAWLAWLRAPAQNFLRWAIAFSLLIHALLLAWAMPAAKPVPKVVPQLEVVMINTFDVEDPLTPDVIAQASLEGGGDQLSGLASNPAPRQGEESHDVSLEAMTQQKRQLETLQSELLTQLDASWQQPMDLSEGQIDPTDPVQGNDPTDQQAVELNARIAAILEDIQHYNARPRRHFDAPSAIANPYAHYVDSWREAVERTGSEHYPGQDDDRPTGEVQVTVILDATGQVIESQIVRPASDPRLNQAVSRILQLAAPFAPFPPEFLQSIDQLVITRTWSFQPGQLSTRAP